jgi:hypothetical protein
MHSLVDSAALEQQANQVAGQMDAWRAPMLADVYGNLSNGEDL